MKYYFAKLNSNNNVTVVHSVAHDDCLDSDGSASETVAINFLNNLFKTSDTYKQTWKERKPNSRERLHRKNLAQVDGTYHVDIDAFSPPKPYNSWSMSTADATWQAPSAMPTDGNSYSWDEDNQTWINLGGASAGG